MHHYCDRCRLYPDCLIWIASMDWQTEDPEYPPQWQYQEDGPVCTAWEGAP